MADIKDFKLPDLGEGLEEGEIVEWQVAVGDEIELNQTVASIETAKAVVDVPSPFAGTVVELIGDEGESIEVGAVFVRIEVGGGGAQAGSGSGDRPSPRESSSATADGAATSPGSASGSVAGDLTEDLAEQAEASGDSGAQPKRASTGLDADSEPQPLVGYGDRGGGARRRRRRGGGGGTGEAGGDAAAAAAVAQAATGSTTPSPEEVVVLAKPPVRKLAKDLGVELSAIAPGSGADGVITREDVQRAADDASRSTRTAAGGTQPTEPSTRTAAGGTQPAGTRRSSVIEALTGAAAGTTAGEKPVPGFRDKAPGEVEPIRGIRKRIVEKMETSRREIPEATCSRDADVTELWEARRDLTAFARDEGLDVKITPFAVVLRAVVLALRRFPTLNASIDRDAGEIVHHQSINLGFAADTDRGLVVPNIKDAQSKSLLQLAVELNDLAAKARDGRIGPNDLTGGTFTVSNYGAFGNDSGNPVINHPEGAILGVGAMRERPWVVDGELAVRRVCTFSLAFDHRISDGGEGGRFVTYVGDLCEHPSRILLHS